MPHPFFDAPTYPLHLPEAEAFLDLLAQNIQQSSNILLAYQQCDASLPPLALGFGARIIWAEVLQNLAMRGKLRKICDWASSYIPHPTALLVIQAVIEAPETQNVKIIDDGTIILDRVTLRAHLAELMSAHGRLKTVVVQGVPGSGKSHSQFLFFHMAKLQNAEAVYIGDGMVATVEEAMRELYRALGASAEFPAQTRNNTTPEAWYLEVCGELLNAAVSRTKQLWIAVDDLGVDANGAPLLDREIKLFFDQLALLMKSPAYQKTFRLMLINYPVGPLPAKWDKSTLGVDTLTATDITEQDVVEVLLSWSKKQKKLLSEDFAKQTATSIITAANTASGSRVGYIAAELQELLKTL